MDQIDKNEHLQLLFPTTKGHLANIKTDIYRFDPYLEGLRNAVRNDFKHLPDHLEDWLRSPVSLEVITDKTKRCYLQDAVHTSGQLLDHVSPQEVMDYLAHSACYVQNDHLPVLAGSVQMLDLALKTLRRNPNDFIGDLIGKDEWRKLINNPMARDFYLGFLWQQGKNICFDKKNNTGACTKTFRDALTSKNAAEVITTINDLLDLWVQVKQIERQISDIDFDALADSLKYEAYRTYTEVATGLIGLAIDVATEMLEEAAAKAARLEEVRVSVRIIEHLSTLTLEVRQKRYSDAILHLSLLLGELNVNDCGLRQNLQRYGLFMANLALCGSSAEVATVIEAFALPPGSASIKKKSGFNVAIGSYVSGFLARETLIDSDKSGNTSIALSAPVGAAVSFPMLKTSSITLYGSLFDVGAITAFRFGNDSEVDALPQLTWENLYAPGVAVIWGVPKYPAAVGLYWQRGPNLRKVETNGIAEYKNAQRIGVMVSVDIPLFNVITVPKKGACN